MVPLSILTTHGQRPRAGDDSGCLYDCGYGLGLADPWLRGRSREHPSSVPDIRRAHEGLIFLAIPDVLSGRRRRSPEWRESAGGGSARPICLVISVMAEGVIGPRQES